MTRRFAALAIMLALVGTVAFPAPAAALTLPKSMAATGDSITRAFNLCFFPFTDCPAQSWSTGSNTTVNSHARRLKITSTAYNDAVSGAKMSDLPGQVNTVSGRNVDYVTVLMGGNDVCTDTEAGMTSPSTYASAFRQAMDKLKTDATPPLVYVLSIPDVKTLWEIFKDNSTARSRWSSYNVCQSLLANPLSTAEPDVDRRERVKQRNMELNQALRTACAEYAFCRFDGERVFGTPFVPSDVSTRDYFHPSADGQKKLSEVSWTHGPYVTSAVNGAPTAAFTASCASLTCTFTDASTDPDGVTSWSWNFDATGAAGRTSFDRHPTHTFAAAGTYTVKLFAIDRYGATASTSASVTVSTDGGGGGTEPTTGAIGGTVTDISGNLLEGAAVSVSGPSSATTTTASDGSYLVEPVQPGEYTVTVSAAGFESKSALVSVVAGVTTQADFALAASPTTDPSTMSIDSLAGIGTRVNRNFWRADITVSVVTESGGATTAVSGATVTGSFSTGGTASCVTDSAGSCSLSSGNFRNNVAATMFSVTSVAHDSLVYETSQPLPSTTVDQPPT